uniref:Ig-like domain-containing protein n=1 Tax=Periophthalmus magnuspinnatus TaxID=409849 RepID=A0A3B4A1H2_9GOBI
MVRASLPDFNSLSYLSFCISAPLFLLSQRWLYSCQNISGKRPVVTLGLEEGMVLDCMCPWNGSLSMVSWTKGEDRQPIAVFHPDLGVSFPHQYRERVEFLRRSPLDGSIALSNVTHQDIGLYHCSVQTFPQGPWSRSIQVEDLGKSHSSAFVGFSAELFTIFRNGIMQKWLKAKSI